SPTACFAAFRRAPRPRAPSPPPAPAACIPFPRSGTRRTRNGWRRKSHGATRDGRERRRNGRKGTQRTQREGRVSFCVLWVLLWLFLSALPLHGIPRMSFLVCAATRDELETFGLDRAEVLEKDRLFKVAGGHAAVTGVGVPLTL